MMTSGSYRGRVVIFAIVMVGVLGLRMFPGADERAAIVCFLEGKATISGPGAKESRDILLFDWLKPGVVLESDESALVVVAFSNGERYELRGKAKATVNPKGFSSVSGTITKIASAPVMPQIASLAGEAKPGSRLSGIRLRGAKREITDLYPGEGSAALADEAVLSFIPVAGVMKYRVEIEDEWGNNVFSVGTNSSEVVISPGVLKPGANYYWSVRTVETTRPSTVSDAVFVTLAADQARLRNTAREQALRNKDAAQLLLLSQLEIALGLRRESCATLKEALAFSPQNDGIIKALARLNCK
jgi:hypothetical protein